MVHGQCLGMDITTRLYEVGTHLLEREDFDYEVAGAGASAATALKLLGGFRDGIVGGATLDKKI